MDQLASKTLAEVYLKQGHFKEAYEVLNALLKKDPSDQDVSEKLDEVKKRLESSPQARPQPTPPGGKIKTLEDWLANIRKMEKTRGDAPIQGRLRSVRKLLSSHRLDGVLFSSLENIRYLCGFTGSDGALIVTQRDSFFLTDSRYWTQAEEEIRGAQIIHYKKKIDGIASLISDLKINSIGIESAALTMASHRSLTEKLPKEINLAPLENDPAKLRTCKDLQEVALIRKAIEIASGAFERAAEIAKEGMPEREIALEMEFFMKRNGAEVLGFDIIIASGARSALPHGKAGEKKIQKGDLILFDYGSRYQGYHSDETCTMICGTPSPEQEKVYRTVREAHDKAIEKVRPGVPIRDVDAAARDHIRNCGYGDYFGHGLGHGVGLMVHEDPFVNPDNKDVVEEGMIFTVEPGIYIPNWGGVRLEDMILVTSQGAELLTPLSKDLRVI